MPCRNAASTLEDALRSIQSQSDPDYELVCVDDGSTDSTPGILLDWARKDTRIRILRQEAAGVIEAANRGLEACRGEIVLRMDADDLCHPERVKLQRAYLEENPEVAVVGCLVEGFPEAEVGEGFRLYYDWLNGLVDHESITREIFVESPMANPSTAFRSSWVRDIGGWRDQGWPEDYDLWLRLYLAGARFAKVPEVLLSWREHPDRLTHTDPRYSLENFLRAKAHYLAQGPARGRDAVFVWGAGMTGRRLSKHLVREGLPLAAFVEVDPKKIGRTRRGRPIIGQADLLREWEMYQHPLLLTAVRARSAAPLIQSALEGLSLVEGKDWWRAA
jgi:glycosyltransferase involved in cell wall biosynthesis